MVISVLDESHGDAKSDTDREPMRPPDPKGGDYGAEEHGINSHHPPAAAGWIPMTPRKETPPPPVLRDFVIGED